MRMERESFKTIRERLRLTQFDAATQSGLSISTIQKFEGGRLISPSPKVVLSLATLYGVSPDDIDAATGKAIPSQSIATGPRRTAQTDDARASNV